jgi:RHS repeat-associated protein
MYDYANQCVLFADKFTGKERDSESGLDDFDARFYSSQYGRFMTPDWSVSPVAVAYADLTDPQTLNLYGYVRNNPLSKVDPNGHCDWCQKLKNWWNYQVWVTNANLNAALATRAAQALQAMHDQGVSIRGQASDAALKGKSNKEIVDTYNRFLSDQSNNRVLAIGTMLGANGAQFTSKTLWESGEAHIDVENPNPSVITQNRPMKVT